jgi:hypothetical protein
MIDEKSRGIRIRRNRNKNSNQKIRNRSRVFVPNSFHIVESVRKNNGTIHDDDWIYDSYEL